MPLPANEPLYREITRSGLAPVAIPEAQSSLTGVSVSYAPDDAHRWYVLRASYNREDLARDLLVDNGVYAYTVKRYEMVYQDGRRRKVLRSLVPNIVFAYLTPRMADLVAGYGADTPAAPCPRLASFVSYYYNHFATDIFGKNPPLTLARREMESFILTTCHHDGHVVLLQPGDYTFRTDDEVVVTEGQFRGVRGRVVRAHGQQRVLVTLSGFLTLGTAYIPTAYLRKV